MTTTARSGEDRPPVTVIGLGAMGSALADALLRAGHPTTVWNRSAKKTDDLVARGAVRAATESDAAAASPLVVVCVLDSDAVLRVLKAIANTIAGRVLVNVTSGTPDQARDAAGWAREHGADYLDGAIMADPDNIGTSQTSLLYSGSQHAFEAHETTLRRLGSSTYLGPDPGIAALHFMALIGLGYETWIGYLRTLALVAAECVDATAFAPFATGMFEASHDLLTAMARAVDTGQHPPAAGPLSVHAALMDDLIQTRQARGIDAETLKEVKDLIDRRVADGRGADGFSSIIETIRPLAARPSADGPKSA